jgi:hypothetical protein
MEEKKGYLLKMAEQLEHLDAKIAALKGKTAEAGEAAKVEINKKIEELSAKQQEARQKLQELKEAGGEKWESLKGRTEKARDSLEEAVTKILSKFKK